MGSIRHRPARAVITHFGMDPLPSLGSERGPVGFRSRFGALISRSSSVDVAATRVRLSLVDFGAGELARLKTMRVLLAEVNAFRMAAEAEAALGHSGRTAALRRLVELLGAGVIRVRSAPMGGWAPDFSVFSDVSGPFAALVGVHSFLEPSPFPGPLFFSEHGRAAAEETSRRFEELWLSSHDVGAMLAPLLRGAAGGASAAAGHTERRSARTR